MKIHLTIHLKSAHFIMVNYATVQKKVWGKKKYIYIYIKPITNHDQNPS